MSCLTASKSRHLKRGVKEVVKSVRKGEKGWVLSFLGTRCGRQAVVTARRPLGASQRSADPRSHRRIIVLAADISPVDILTHIPLLAEEANCPYIVRAPPWWHPTLDADNRPLRPSTTSLFTFVDC